MSAEPDEAAVPAFRPGARLRFDEVRGSWIVLAPERMFVPDDIAVEILKLIDGRRSFGEIIDDLASRFDAPRAAIAGDVVDMLQQLRAKGTIGW